MRLRRFVMTVALAMALVPGPAAYADLNYRVEITGAEDSELADLLDSVSELKTLEEKPAKVAVTVKPGPLYHVASVKVLGPDGQPLSIPQDEKKLTLKPGDPARTAPVVATETALLGEFGDSGHPFAKVENRRVEIDRDTQTMEVTYTLDPGRVMRFGPLVVGGLERLDPAYVEGRLRWQRGEIYDASKVEETRRALI